MTFDTAKVDSPDAREASMSRVQTQETVMASLVTPTSVETAKESQDPKPDDKPSDGEQRPKKTANERFQELANKRREAEDKASTSELRAQKLEAENAVLRAQAPPIQATDKPVREQFTNEDNYIESLAKWLAKGIVAEREYEQREAQLKVTQTEIATQWDLRQQEAIKNIDDYAEVVGGSEIEIPPYVEQTMLKSKYGPELAYYFALNPKEAKSLTSMDPLDAVRKVIDLEYELANAADDKPATKTTSDSPKKSRAPEPITPVKGIATSTAGPAANYEDYKRRRLNK